MKKREDLKMTKFYAETIEGRGNQCELCRKPLRVQLPLFVHFVDRDPNNRDPENLAVLCWSCRNIFIQSNPEGLNQRQGLFDFAINRKLYPFLKDKMPIKSIRR